MLKPFLILFLNYSLPKAQFSLFFFPSPFFFSPKPSFYFFFLLSFLSLFFFLIYALPESPPPMQPCAPHATLQWLAVIHAVVMKSKAALPESPPLMLPCAPRATLQWLAAVHVVVVKSKANEEIIPLLVLSPILRRPAIIDDTVGAWKLPSASASRPSRPPPLIDHCLAPMSLNVNMAVIFGGFDGSFWN